MLQQLAFSEIKVDRSFVGDMAASTSSRAIVKSIFDLSTNLGMTCIAVGVETEQTAHLQAQIGISQLLGYFIARPMAVEAVPIWLLH